MQILYLSFLILKAYKFVEGGVINTNGFKYEPGLYLNSKGQSKDVSSARIISEDPFIISLETKDKEIELNRRKKLPKKRNRTKRETEGVMDKLGRMKRCHHHHHHGGRLSQRKRELRHLGKTISPKNETSFDPEMVTKELDRWDTYENSKNSTPDCVIQISDDQTLNDLIEEIRRLKIKLKDLLIYVANGTVPSEAEGRNEKGKSLNEMTALEDEDRDSHGGLEDHGEDLKNHKNHEHLKDQGLNHTDHEDPEDLKDHNDLDHRNQDLDNKDHEDLDYRDHENLEDYEDIEDHNDLKDLEDEAFADDRAILKNKIDFLSKLIDEPGNDTEEEKIPDDVIQKWKDSPVLNLLYIPEKNPYKYELLDDSENEEERNHPSDDRNLLEDKIKYLQSILESDDVKSRKKREADDESPCRIKKVRCARDRVTSSQNKERYKSKKWMDDLKLKRSQSRSKPSCPCSACNKEKSEEADSFEMSEEIPYVEEIRSNDKVLKWSKKNADPDPFMDDLEMYRERAKQILKNAQEILRRIKETEEKMKKDEDYLESDWGGEDYAIDKNKKTNDSDMEDLVLELVKKVGKRLQQKRKRLEDSEESSESEEVAEDETEKLESGNEDSAKETDQVPNHTDHEDLDHRDHEDLDHNLESAYENPAKESKIETDDNPEVSELEKIILKKAEEMQTPKPKDEVLQEIQDLVPTTQPDSTETTASPFLNLLKGTDVMKDHRDKPPEPEEKSTDPTSTDAPEPVKLPDNLPESNDNLQVSKLGIESTSSVEKLMDDFQDGKLDENDMKTIQNLNDKKVDTLIDEIDEAEDGTKSEAEAEDGAKGEAEAEDCEEELNECQTVCDCGDKSDEVDKYEIMKSFLLWIKEMHLYNVLDNYPKLSMQNN